MCLHHNCVDACQNHTNDLILWRNHQNTSVFLPCWSIFLKCCHLFSITDQRNYSGYDQSRSNTQKKQEPASYLYPQLYRLRLREVPMPTTLSPSRAILYLALAPPIYVFYLKDLIYLKIFDIFFSPINPIKLLLLLYL